MCALLSAAEHVKVPIAILALATMLGCGRGSGFLREAGTAGDHQFRMEIVSQRYSRSVSGASSTGSVFCLIPTTNGAYKSAMSALHGEAQLKTNEVLENIREDHAFLSLLIYCEDDLIISADVYEVVPAATLERSHAPAERGPELAPPSPHPPASEQFEPSDPYVPPPSNPYPAPPIRASDGGARASDPEICERAHAHLAVDMPGLFRAIFPNARFVDAPPKASFVAACTEQVDDVQLCLQAAFLKSHVDPCRGAFRDMTPEQRTRLFGTFLREW